MHLKVVKMIHLMLYMLLQFFFKALLKCTGVERTRRSQEMHFLPPPNDRVFSLLSPQYGTHHQPLALPLGTFTLPVSEVSPLLSIHTLAAWLGHQVWATGDGVKPRAAKRHSPR